MANAVILLALGLYIAGRRHAALVFVLVLVWMMTLERRKDLRIPRR
jgi:hypothetical protein